MKQWLVARCLREIRRADRAVKDATELRLELDVQRAMRRIDKQTIAELKSENARLNERLFFLGERRPA